MRAQVLATQQVASIPDSLLLLESPAAGAADEAQDAQGAGSLFLHIGATLKERDLHQTLEGKRPSATPGPCIARPSLNNCHCILLIHLAAKVTA